MFRGVRRRALNRFLRAAPDTAAEMVFEWPALYNADADELQAVDRAGVVTQLAPPALGNCTSSYELRSRRLEERITLGAHSVFDALAPAVPRQPPAAWRRAA